MFGERSVSKVTVIRAQPKTTRLGEDAITEIILHALASASQFDSVAAPLTVKRIRTWSQSSANIYLYITQLSTYNKILHPKISYSCLDPS